MKILRLNHTLLILVFLAGFINSHASTLVDGIYYELNSDAKTATVTYKSYDFTVNRTYVSGNVTIPAYITVDKINYTVTSIGGSAFNDCESMTSISIPNTITAIESDAFNVCTGLSILNIPNSVKTIGTEAFQICSGLTSVTLGRSLASIGGRAFGGCSKIKTLNVYSPVPPKLDSTAFDANIFSITLNVPRDTKSTYQSALVWKNFLTIKESSIDNGSNNIFMNDTTTYSGAQIKIPIFLTNADSITAFQLDLYLPNAITIAKDTTNQPLIEFGNRTTTLKHSINYGTLTNGAFRIVGISFTNAIFKGNSGPLLYLTLNVPDSIVPGNYNITMKNIRMSTPNGIEHVEDETTSKFTIYSYQLGDVDNNDEISISDAVDIISYVLGSSKNNFIFRAADLDHNNTITINDAVILIKNILGNSTPTLNAFSSEHPINKNTADIYISPISLNPGEEKTIDVFMDNPDDQITAFQFDMKLPTGITFQMDHLTNIPVTKSERLSPSHLINYSMQKDSALRITCFSTKNTCITGNGGAIASIKIKADLNLLPGLYPILINHKHLAHVNGQNEISPVATESSLNIGISGIKTIQNNKLHVSLTKGQIKLSSAISQKVTIISSDGKIIDDFYLQGGETHTIKTTTGIYLINGYKLIVK